MTAGEAYGRFMRDLLVHFRARANQDAARAASNYHQGHLASATTSSALQCPTGERYDSLSGRAGLLAKRQATASLFGKFLLLKSGWAMA